MCVYVCVHACVCVCVCACVSVCALVPSLPDLTGLMIDRDTRQDADKDHVYWLNVTSPPTSSLAHQRHERQEDDRQSRGAHS